MLAFRLLLLLLLLTLCLLLSAVLLLFLRARLLFLLAFRLFLLLFLLTLRLLLRASLLLLFRLRLLFLLAVLILFLLLILPRLLLRMLLLFFVLIVAVVGLVWCTLWASLPALDGTLEAIQDKYGSDTVRLRLEDDGASLDDLPGVVKVTDFGRLKELRLDCGADAQDLLRRLMTRGKIRHFELTRPSLHDIFVRIAAPEGEENHHA